MIDRIAGPVLLLGLGLVGGVVADVIGTPIPYLLGSLLTVGAFVVFYDQKFAFPLYFPMKIREVFVAVIGTMIGSTFTPEGVAAFQTAWISFAAVIAFIVVALATNFAIFTKMGGYSRPNAYYSSMPGGLVDSVTLGEQAGGDPRVLSIQHFVRIVIIVTLVPVGFWIWTGEAVGSAAGATFDQFGRELSPFDWGVLLITAIAGYLGGKILRLPAYWLMGPLISAAIVHGAGFTDAQLPDWMLGFAQLIVGVGFGSRFAGMDRQMLLKGLGLGFVSTSAMLILGVAFAWFLTSVTDQAIDVLFLCFAPGGITEMGLVALSLNANPVFVTAHHLLRIIVTVAIAAITVKWAKHE